MPDPKEQTEIESLAALHDGLGHPTRVAMLLALRKKHELTSAELRRAVSASYSEIDTRRLQFHLYKMQAAGIVTVRAAGRGDTITLVRDITLKARDVT